MKEKKNLKKEKINKKEEKKHTHTHTHIIKEKEEEKTHTLKFIKQNTHTHTKRKKKNSVEKMFAAPETLFHLAVPRCFFIGNPREKKVIGKTTLPHFRSLGSFEVPQQVGLLP